MNLEKYVSYLEKENAALEAENATLKAQLSKSKTPRKAKSEGTTTEPVIEAVSVEAHLQA